MLRVVALLLLVTASVLGSVARASNPVVRVTTDVGSFDIELCQEVSTLCLGIAPNTVANFLSYVDSGAYHDSFVHRSIGNANAGGLIQGGTFVANHLSFPVTYVPDSGDIPNEFNQSNERGTISVPLANRPDAVNPTCDTLPDSGSSGWFVNVADNSGLDCGLFTVFGVVNSEEGMTVVSAINSLFRLSLQFGTTPLLTSYQCNPNANQQCTGNPVPYFVYTEFSRVPEAGTALSAAVALGSLAAVKRRRA